jgi:signal transduction histidine kinase
MSRLKSIRLPVSANLKITLVMLALLIVAALLFFTQQLVSQLKQSERKTVSFYARMLTHLSSSEQTQEDLSGLIYEMAATIDFPVIQTDPDLQPLSSTYKGRDTSYDDNVRNIDVDTLAPPYQQRAALVQRIAEMRSIYDPFPIYSITKRDSIAMTDSGEVWYAISDSMVVSYLCYDDSEIVKQLRWLPYVEIGIAAMFIFVGYISFSHIKRNEQSNIWVGMAKETAHQLGTPLSSLMGWIELMRLMPEDQQQVMEATEEMKRDVNRLTRVAQRFSKIGSAAEVKPVEINAVISSIIGYFQRRLPHLGKKVVLTLEGGDPVYVAINVDLFEWVFENMVRNAADAIDRIDGEIHFRVRQLRGSAVIDVRDNGRGIDPKIRKDIFRPGFSTKKRGWGLGLSLAKRIVEDYHGGKITLKDSSPRGTTFRIVLNAIEPPNNRIEQPIDEWEQEDAETESKG